MPYHVERAGKKYLVKDDKDKVYGEHKSRKEAQAQIYAIEMSEKRRGK
jgi:hypothetical protein